jgi:ribosomal protein S18 acetylase RimI-like enzyme
VGRVSVRVRAATDADVPAVVALVQSVDTASGSFSGRPLMGATSEHLTERLEQLVSEPERQLLVATDETGSIIGMLSARSDEIGVVDVTPVLHVTHLMVTPGQRRRGVGRALLAGAVQVAEEQGLQKVLATAAAGSREGNRYLARIGFAPLVVHRLASTATLRRSLGMTDVAGRMAVLRRTRLVRAQRAGFATRPASRSI